ncbi:MAG: tRNA uridine-5-carboxymethylaminomethyl(34) synthesis GTPase MnmE [Candidatus Marinimicrobia bacterium]|nr:tRNA uridine-5-carboxymethylaminomethyl(34) synthesis GTPase MnmE [Candidatus Neomarinimicrobiota bacterium]MBL7023316.1 tRNA uridine-5-carboxymethylaminomethyl(34) synthesis GTPase MnmE [Candidatus Neomarinimicrobiota bacterium]
MSSYRNDTITALATPPGEGAIAVIRLSGKSLKTLLSDLTNGKKLVPRYATYTPVYSHSSGDILDNCLITYFMAPNSYTGEDVAEISCHGGDVVSKLILNDLYSRGARQATPGEFTFRAFMNGKMDLVQAEAVSALISSKTELGVSANLTNLSGLLSDNISSLKQQALDLLSLVEHEMDFSEEEITITSKGRILETLNIVSDNLKSSLKTAVLGKVISGGVRVVLFGLPNTGKSNLFNNILGHERAIVSSVPGTTRDTIEAWFNLDGFPVCLIDTAGVWETEDYLESLGIKKTISEIDLADIVLFVDDKDPVDVFDRLHIKINPEKVIFVKTKEDLHPTKLPSNKISYTSSKKDIGFNKLLTSISTALSDSFVNNSENNPILTTSRQRISIEKADDLLSGVIDLVSNNFSIDIVASSLRSFVLILEEIIGEVSSKDIIENIFKSFCVGK